LALRAGDALARAERYRRDLSVAVVLTENAAELGQIGPRLVRALGRWDVVGRANGDRPALAVVLPETNRNETSTLLTRLAGILNGAPTGVAVYPEDGLTVAELVRVAGARTARPAGLMLERTARIPSTVMWTRGDGHNATDDVVRCPRCLAAYARRRPAAAEGEALARARAAALALLHRECPRHRDQLPAAA
jgi:hypothetical protein